MKLNDLKLLREQAYINGQWVDADDGSRFAVTNPADGEVIAQISSLGQAETARAIAAAQAALPAWRGKTAKDRSKVLRTWFELIMAH
jgi:succinate-semialdehyde dehydrogenase/glutarate-semialdehyde dehydrogenase